MKLFALIFLTAVLACGAIWFAQQRALRKIQEGNEVLRRQIAQRQEEKLRPQSNSPLAVKLPLPEQKELLQLRARMSSLRDELQRASNTVAILEKTTTARRSH